MKTKTSTIILLAILALSVWLSYSHIQQGQEIRRLAAQLDSLTHF